MTSPVSEDPLGFIRRCLHERKIVWTYHVAKRMPGRGLTRVDILNCVASLEIIESYPDDKYLPSYLLLGTITDGPLHVLAGVDVTGDSIWIVTVYRPDPREWDETYRRRRSP